MAGTHRRYPPPLMGFVNIDRAPSPIPCPIHIFSGVPKGQQYGANLNNKYTAKYKGQHSNNIIRIRKGIHLVLDTWIVPGQTGKPPPGSGKRLQTSNTYNNNTTIL